MSDHYVGVRESPDSLPAGPPPDLAEIHERHLDILCQIEWPIPCYHCGTPGRWVPCYKCLRPACHSCWFVYHFSQSPDDNANDNPCLRHLDEEASG